MIAAHEVNLEVVIVGAGLGGLAAALACRLAGHKVTILESAKKLTEVGAGLQLTPNGVKLLRRWGLGPELDRLSAAPSTISVLRYSDGKILAHEDNFQQGQQRKYGEAYLDTHRADLQKTMYDRCIELGVEVHLNQRVHQVETTTTPVQITTESHSIFTADLVIGADGLWSRCRELLLNTTDHPLPTGDLAYRIILTLDEVTDPDLRALISQPGVRFWIGPQAHVVGYSLKAGTMYNLVLLCPDDLPAHQSRTAASLEEVRSFFANWDPILRRLLEHVKQVDKWKLMHRTELDSWTNPARNFVLLGDACHPMLPYLAQGANSALEDGAVLGRLLSYVNRKDQLGQAVGLYETLRKKRSAMIARETFKQRADFHMPDGPEQEQRDRVFESQLGKDEVEVKFPSRWTCPEVQSWIYGYDADQEADNAAREMFE